jgi:hypothetical protein
MLLLFVIGIQVEGSVKLGNRTLTANDLDYVPQFDDLNEFFTVSYCSNSVQPLQLYKVLVQLRHIYLAHC